MTERAKALRDAVVAAIDHAEHTQQSHATYVLRAVVEELGVTEEDVDALHGGAAMADEGGTPGIADDLRDLAVALATLLEASGAER